MAELKRRKKVLEDAKPKEWDREPFEDLLKRRFVYAPSFEVYGGVAGLYDYGPTGCAIKENLLTAWRRHFILEEGMYQIDCPAMTPEMVRAPPPAAAGSRLSFFSPNLNYAGTVTCHTHIIIHNPGVGFPFQKTNPTGAPGHSALRMRRYSPRLGTSKGSRTSWSATLKPGSASGLTICSRT